MERRLGDLKAREKNFVHVGMESTQDDDFSVQLTNREVHGCAHREHRVCGRRANVFCRWKMFGRACETGGVALVERRLAPGHLCPFGPISDPGKPCVRSRNMPRAHSRVNRRNEVARWIARRGRLELNSRSALWRTGRMRLLVVGPKKVVAARATWTLPYVTVVI